MLDIIIELVIVMHDDEQHKFLTVENEDDGLVNRNTDTGGEAATQLYLL